MNTATSPLQVVVLAAGQGKRMYSDLPKVLHPLAGKPLLRHVLETASGLGAGGLCVVIGHGGDQVRARIGDAPGLQWALQAQQLGTGHAVMQALPHLSGAGAVLVLYGDVPLIAAATLRELVAAAGPNRLALLTQVVASPRGYGRIVRDASGRVTRIVEEKDATEAERSIREVNTGIMVVPRAKLEGWLKSLKNTNAQGEYYLTDLVAAAVADGVAVETRQPAQEYECLGVNSKVELAQLERHFQRREADRLLGMGVGLADPARIDVRGTLECGRDVFIDVNCVFEGRVILGDGVSVGPQCVLREVEVGPGTEIKPFSILEETRVGANARIGPYARTRPGTVLSDEVHIGNFVEVKASSFGRGSKANHLAYVGDSTVGSAVNIGAGTITCNYDGANKHRTVIEDDCFIGSDATLVAPVRIAKGSYIGAGSTISKNTPAGQLTVARAKQVSIPSWKPPKKAKKD
jgi:bifunctional UDP-N-acetylglucosamine pyrophosphorylase/glucosamine-1-phosphate N-acetyltransferase